MRISPAAIMRIAKQPSRDAPYCASNVTIKHTWRPPSTRSPQTTAPGSAKAILALALMREAASYPHRVLAVPAPNALIMAFGIPAIAWVENSALFFFLIAAGVLGIGAVLWWHWRERQ